MRTSWKNQRGSITLVALCLAVVIGISLGSYLALCNQSLQFSTRTLQFSKARLLAETGLEEALWSLNSYANPDTTVSTNAWSNATWTTTGANKSCTITGYSLGEGATGDLAITVANYDGPTTAVSTPVITVTATIIVPGFGTFTKTLTTTAKPAPLFTNALGVINPPPLASPVPQGSRFSSTYAVLFGRSFGTTVDSWNSDPDKDYNVASGTPAVIYAFTAGTPSNYAGVVAAPNIYVNGATINGYAETFGNSITSSASRSHIQGPTPSGTNVDTTRVGKSAFVPDFGPNNLPTGAAGPHAPLDGNSTTINNTSGTTPLLVESSPSDLTLNGTTVTIMGHVVIRVDGSLDLRGGGKFDIQTGAQLELFVRNDVTIGSNSGFLTPVPKHEPKNLALYIKSGDLIYNSALPFTGVVYLDSIGSMVDIKTSPIIYGAILARNNIQFGSSSNTTPQIHYDTALQYLPKGWFSYYATPFIIDRVTESIAP